MGAGMMVELYSTHPWLAEQTLSLISSVCESHANPVLNGQFVGHYGSEQKQERNVKR